MLTVRTFIGPSKIHGTGLFAAERLKKGQIWWANSPLLDIALTKDEVENMPPVQQEFVNTYGYLNENDMWIICLDNARFVNHSETPNTSEIYDPKNGIDVCIAERDIEVGEELTCDYRKICKTCRSDDRAMSFVANETRELATA